MQQILTYKISVPGDFARGLHDAEFVQEWRPGDDLHNRTAVAIWQDLAQLRPGRRPKDVELVVWNATGNLKADPETKLYAFEARRKVGAVPLARQMSSISALVWRQPASVVKDIKALIDEHESGQNARERDESGNKGSDT